MQPTEARQLQLEQCVLYRGQVGRIRRLWTSMNFNTAQFQAHFDVEIDGEWFCGIDYRELQVPALRAA